MTKVYLISNNCFMDDLIVYKDFMSVENKRRYRPLTTEGEKEALKIVKKIGNIDSVFASSYFSTIDSAKYTIEKNNIDLIVDKRFDDRKLGELKDNTLNLRNLQEHDFSYKLKDGESLNDVKNRMKSALKEIIMNRDGENIAIYTHNISITSLLSIWCEKDFNVDDKLMLSYNDNIIIDGLYSDSLVVELLFKNEKITDIKRID